MSLSLCLPSMLDRVKCGISVMSEHKPKPNNASYLDSIDPDNKSYTQTESTNTSTHCTSCLKVELSLCIKKQLSICK